MTDAIAKFISDIVACQSAIQAIVNGGAQKTDIEAYGQAKFNLMESATKASESWMESGFDTAGAKVLIENPGLRTLIGPLQAGYEQIQAKWEEVKQSLPDVTQAEILVAALMQSNPAILFAEAQEYNERLSTLATSAAAQNLLQKEAPETWAALCTPQPSPAIAPAKPSEPSGGPG